MERFTCDIQFPFHALVLLGSIDIYVAINGVLDVKVTFAFITFMANDKVYFWEAVLEQLTIIAHIYFSNLLFNTYDWEIQIKRFLK